MDIWNSYKYTSTLDKSLNWVNYCPVGGTLVEIYGTTYSICFSCGEGCNQHSQECGRCQRNGRPSYLWAIDPKDGSIYYH